MKYILAYTLTEYILAYICGILITISIMHYIMYKHYKQQKPDCSFKEYVGNTWLEAGDVLFLGSILFPIWALAFPLKLLCDNIGKLLAKIDWRKNEIYPHNNPTD